MMCSSLTIRCYLLVCSLLLLCRLDETTRVSAWVSSPPQCHRNVNNGAPKTIIYSTVKDAETSIKVDESPIIGSAATVTATTPPSVSHQLEQQLEQSQSISMPSIQYTVPGMKVGWKDSETDLWMDEDGPRNGPPQNYWRQQSDEKLYKESMKLVQDLLLLQSSSSKEDTTTAATTTTSELLINELVQPIEKSNSVRRPILNRMILNDWVPIVRGGKVVATDKSTNNYSNEIDVPYFFHIQRTAGQKLGPKTPYGTFDEHLKPEEEITIQQLVNTNVVSSGVVQVSPDNENRLVKGCCTTNNDDLLYIGGITYVSKYVMIMRQQEEEKNYKDSPVTEIWMKVDSKM